MELETNGGIRMTYLFWSLRDPKLSSRFKGALHCSTVAPACIKGERPTLVMARSSGPLTTTYRLFAVGLGDLSHELCPGHVDGTIDGSSLRPRIVLENLHHQRRIVGEDDAGLQHAQ